MCVFSTQYYLYMLYADMTQLLVHYLHLIWRTFYESYIIVGNPTVNDKIHCNIINAIHISTHFHLNDTVKTNEYNLKF